MGIQTQKGSSGLSSTGGVMGFFFGVGKYAEKHILGLALFAVLALILIEMLGSRDLEVIKLLIPLASLLIGYLAGRRYRFFVQKKPLDECRQQ